MQRLLVLLVLPCVAAAFTAPSPLARPAVPQRVPVLQAAASVAEAPPPTNEAQAGAPLDDEKPLSGPQRVVRALTFWSKVVPILAAYKAAELQSSSDEEAEAKYEELHDWGSDRLQGAINELKGFYVKCAGRACTPNARASQRSHALSCARSRRPPTRRAASPRTAALRRSLPLFCWQVGSPRSPARPCVLARAHSGLVGAGRAR